MRVNNSFREACCSRRINQHCCVLLWVNGGRRVRGRLRGLHQILDIFIITDFSNTEQLLKKTQFIVNMFTVRRPAPSHSQHVFLRRSLSSGGANGSWIPHPGPNSQPQRTVFPHCVQKVDCVLKSTSGGSSLVPPLDPSEDRAAPDPMPCPPEEVP